MSLGVLGGTKRRRAGRHAAHGVHGLGKLTSPTEWTIASGEWPSTVSYGVLKSWTRWPELAYPGSGLTASSTAISPWKVGQVLKLPAAWTPGVTAAPAPSTTLPFQVGVKDATALKWQYMLNTELSARGLPTVPEDGVFNAATCAGFGAFVRSYQAAPNDPTPDDTFAGVVIQYQAAIVQACTTLAKPTVTATVVAPAPVAAPAVNGPALMRQMQAALNTWLASIGYNQIPVTGAWDAATCGAAIMMDKTLANTDPKKVPVATLLAQIRPVLGMPCGTTVQPLTPARPVAAARPPVPPPVVSPSGVRSAALPPLNRDGECVINFGQRYAEIGLLQDQLNYALAQNGYNPIPVTEVWDAATCGAMFQLGGKFSPSASSGCPHAYSVPLSCPTMAKPVPVAPPPAPKQASVVLPIGIAAVLGVVALVLAKKKGLIMAAKKGGSVKSAISGLA